PDTRYARIVNQVTTGGAGSTSSAEITTDSLGPGGRRTVVLSGSLPAGGKAMLVTYKVAQPDRFAAEAFRRALEDAGIRSAGAGPHRSPKTAPIDSAAMLVAEHVSPPFKEAAKVILKVSQNLHASMMPFVLGAVRGKEPTAQAGFD